MDLDPGLLHALNFEGELTRRETIRAKLRAAHHGPAIGSGTAARRFDALILASLRRKAAARIHTANGIADRNSLNTARAWLAEASSAARPNLPG